jgi:hypothetical protein
VTDETRRLETIARTQATVADKIRALAAAGVPRADIARFLGKRYQHVRNVLEGDAQSSSGGYVLGYADVSGVREGATPYKVDDDPSEIDRRSSGIFWLRVRADGSLPLPAEVVEALAAKPGQRVFAQLKDGSVTLLSSEAAADQAREMVRRLIPRGVDLVGSLLADRAAEAARDLEDD